MSEFRASGDAVRWGFIGAGKMASAMIQGMLAKGVTVAERVAASDPVASIRDSVRSRTGIHVSESNVEVIKQSDVIILAVKPQSMAKGLGELRPSLTKGHLIISIAAGISLQKLADYHGPGLRVVRVMPNTPCLVGEGASAYAMGAEATESDEVLVKTCLEAVGLAFKVPETLLDAVTGLSGSGPAYVYTMIEALSDGGVRVGRPREMATALAAQTVLGAAKMVLHTKEHTGVLKDQVASPGGTTIAGIHALERGNIRATLMDAVQAAFTRSKDLGSS